MILRLIALTATALMLAACLGGKPKMTRQQSLEKAQSDVEANSNDALAHANLGGELRLSGRIEEALAQFDKAETLAKASPDPLVDWSVAYNRGIIAKDRGQIDQAKAYLEKAVAIDVVSEAELSKFPGPMKEAMAKHNTKTERMTRHILHQVYRRLNNPAKAQAELEWILASHPTPNNSIDARRHAGIFLKRGVGEVKSELENACTNFELSRLRAVKYDLTLSIELADEHLKKYNCAQFYPS